MKMNKTTSLLLLMTIVALIPGCGKKKELSEMEVYPDRTEGSSTVTTATEEKEGLNQSPKEESWAQIAGDDAFEYTTKSPNGIPIVETKDYLYCIQLPDLSTISYDYETVQIQESDDYTKTQALLAKDAQIVDDANATARMGDKVYISMETNAADGFHYNNYTYDQLYVPLGSATLPPEVESGIVGMKVAEKKTLNISFPEDSDSLDFAGDDIVFDITLISIARAQDPTQEELDKEVDQQKKINDGNNRYTKYNTIKKELISNTKITAYPKAIIDELKKEYESTFFKEGTLDDYLASVGGDRQMFMTGENEYIWGTIDSKMVLIALKEKTGINEESESYKEIIQRDGISVDDPDAQMYEAIIDTLYSQYGKK